jgi:hypothetical protein
MLSAFVQETLLRSYHKLLCEYKPYGYNLHSYTNTMKDGVCQWLQLSL